MKKPPVLALQGKKWVCEYQDNNKEIVIETDGVNQTLYAYKCTGCTIQVKGKINAITLDNCKKTAIVFESCVAAFEIVNSQSVQAQVTGLVQTISIDKTDGAQIYLSKESLGASIVSAKSSEMNVSVPNPTDPDGDMVCVQLFGRFFNLIATVHPAICRSWICKYLVFVTAVGNAGARAIQDGIQPRAEEAGDAANRHCRLIPTVVVLQVPGVHVFGRWEERSAAPDKVGCAVFQFILSILHEVVNVSDQSSASLPRYTGRAPFLLVRQHRHSTSMRKPHARHIMRAH